MKEIRQNDKGYDRGQCPWIDSPVCSALLVGNLLQQTYNMIDAALSAVFGHEALAVLVLQHVQFLVLGFCTGLCSGFGVRWQRFRCNQFGRMRKDIFMVLC